MATARAVPSLAASARYALFGWTFFIAENAVLSENRTYIISQLFDNDEQTYHAAYGTLSTLAMAMIAAGYTKVKNTRPFLPITPPRLIAAFALQSFGLATASQMAPKLQVSRDSKTLFLN